jgi:hypothetical protein
LTYSDRNWCITLDHKVVTLCPETAPMYQPVL